MEQLARRHLELAGLDFIQANYTIRGGEIDLIMSDANCLVFVEVRYRLIPGRALESVLPAKQKRIARTAQYYLYKNQLQNCQCRFDLVVLSGCQDEPGIKWLKNAWYDT